MSNPVIHFEVMGKDGDALRSFYNEMFDWGLENMDGPMDYGMTRSTGDEGIGGGVGAAPEGPGHVTFYVGVDDIDAALAKAASLGGKTVMPTMSVGEGENGVSFALFSDPEGHVVGVVKTA